MSQQELVVKVVRVLNKAGIGYVLTGSVVSSLQGEPRSTHDVDFVIAIDGGQVEALLEAFPPPSYYLDKQAMEQAIRAGTTFNLIDTRGGDKVDFWLLTDSEFDQSRFNRKYSEDVFGVRMNVTRPEDTILMKLKWAEMSGGSEKQFTDALRVFEVQYEKLDIGYLESWADRLGVRDTLRRLERDARPISPTTDNQP